MTILACYAAALRQGRTAAGRYFSTAAIQDPLQFCVVGSGPAGFYTVDRILKRFEGARVDIVEALPTPFGLVRSGVAPDHPDTKNVINQFTNLAKDSRVSFLGNVRVGSPALSLSELRSFYNAVVLSYGAESDRKLHIPGECAHGVLSAREFVWWYNGHPSMSPLEHTVLEHTASSSIVSSSSSPPRVDLSSVRSVAICGLGNVAVDCARVLLRNTEDLAKTDIATHAIKALEKSGVKEVHLLGRRGPAQAAFTPKELRELLGLEGVAVHIHPEGCLDLSAACQEEIKGNRIKKRIVEVMTKATKEPKEGDRALHLHFLSSPTEFLKDDNGKIAGVQVERTQLHPRSTGGGGQSAKGTGVYEDIPAQLVLESIGYASLPLEGAAFDHKAGIVPNVLGQAEAIDGATDPGLYVCGWLKRGPSGIIGTNLVDAEQTVDTMVQQQGSFPGVHAAVPGGEGLRQLLESRGQKVVSFDGWQRIDDEEVKRGQVLGKPREKLTSVEEMLQIAGGGAGEV